MSFFLFWYCYCCLGLAHYPQEGTGENYWTCLIFAITIKSSISEYIPLRRLSALLAPSGAKEVASIIYGLLRLDWLEKLRRLTKLSVKIWLPCSLQPSLLAALRSDFFFISNLYFLRSGFSSKSPVSSCDVDWLLLCRWSWLAGPGSGIGGLSAGDILPSGM